MLEPPCRVPPADRARSCCAIAKPAPRSTKVKQPDFITKTVSRASGDSSPSGTHHLSCGSWIASAPSLRGQLGISACFWAVLSSMEAAETGVVMKDDDATATDAAVA